MSCARSANGAPRRCLAGLAGLAGERPVGCPDVEVSVEVAAPIGLGLPERGGRGAAEVELEVWHAVMAVNLTGVWLSAKSCLPVMIDAGGGSIINQGSITALIGFENSAAYSASKGGVIALTRQMAVDYAPHDVRVSAICPGVIETPLLRRSWALAQGVPESEVDDLLAEHWHPQIPMRRLGAVDDIAATAVYLASDESAWTTGSILTVDGGQTVA